MTTNLIHKFFSHILSYKEISQENYSNYKAPQRKVCFSMNCQGSYSVLIQIHKGCLTPYVNGVKSPTYIRLDETACQGKFTSFHCCTFTHLVDRIFP